MIEYKNDTAWGRVREDLTDCIVGFFKFCYEDGPWFLVPLFLLLGIIISPLWLTLTVLSSIKNTPKKRKEQDMEWERERKQEEEKLERKKTNKPKECEVCLVEAELKFNEEYWKHCRVEIWVCKYCVKGIPVPEARVLNVTERVGK